MKARIFLTLLISLLAVSCTDILDVENENAYDGNTFFTTPEAYEEAATAMYSPLLMQGLYAREYYFIFDLLGNDAAKNFPLQGSLLEFPLYAHTPANGDITNLFNSLYKMAFRTTFVLDLMEKWEPVVDDEIAEKVRISGEAHFLRGLSYFMLVTLWGDIPLKTSLDDFAELHSGRTPVSEVWEAVEADLNEAVANLPVSYDAADLGRATKGAAVALLGKSYLYQKKYGDAITQLSKLTSSPYDYELASSLDDIFLYDNKTKETVFAVMHAEWEGWGVGNAYYVFGGQEKWGGKATHSDRAQEYGFNDWWNVLASDALVESFNYTDESGNSYIDPRAALTFYGDGSKGGDTDYVSGEYDFASKGRSWRKYQRYEYMKSEGLPQSPINSQIIRYADVLLMLAEAYIENGQPGNALPLINQVRARSGAFEYSSLGSQEKARSIVRHERQMELAGEQSRFYDLVRWGILQKTINAEKGENIVKDYHVLLPIPQAERDANPVLDEQVKNNWN